MQNKGNTHVQPPPPNTYTLLIHLVQLPNVPALWHAKHSVNIIQRMVTVTMAARQLKHGTVVLFNIWLRRRTACFYHIILSQERRLLHADVPTPLCSPRSPAVAMFLPYLTTTTKANWLRTVCPWYSPTDTLFTVCITWDAFIAVCERLTNTTDNKK